MDRNRDPALPLTNLRLHKIVLLLPKFWVSSQRLYYILLYYKSLVQGAKFFGRFKFKNVSASYQNNNTM